MLRSVGHPSARAMQGDAGMWKRSHRELLLPHFGGAAPDGETMGMPQTGRKPPDFYIRPCPKERRTSLYFLKDFKIIFL